MLRPASANTMVNKSVASKSHRKSTLPSISWNADDSALLWKLLSEMEKRENAKVLFGKKEKNRVIEK
ncbi:hypothetical protein PILCRDRAFT_743132 [Piloderma croceum F 1598]|uniref:Uncharacterized protein n=1 Tax=Piloderma croceum (strain F 1598) TaxID=765440 RepID=A0A0C3EWY4_PILCF|nr:hypothetical protein PILCRDRAFT_743132 [Piloderma croceum F 1598]